MQRAISIFEGSLGWKLDSHDLMVGVLVNGHTLSGERSSKFEVRYPKIRELSKILNPHRRVLNLVHYSTHEKDTLGTQLMDVMRLTGNYLDGFQLNVAWPEPVSLNITRGMRMVLQLGSGAIKAMDANPEAIAERLDQYDGLITDVLIDRSGGRRQPFDIHETIALFEAIRARHPELALGVAGGLCKNKVPNLSLLRDKFGSNFSADAEGEMRNEWDRLKWDDMTDYLQSCLNFFRYV